MERILSEGNKQLAEARNAVKALRKNVKSLVSKSKAKKITPEESNRLLNEARELRQSAEKILETINGCDKEAGRHRESLRSDWRDCIEMLDCLPRPDAVTIDLGEATLVSDLQSQPESLDNVTLVERSKQIENIKASVHGIKDLYVQVGDMVELQGEQIDDIENNMLTSADNSRITARNIRATHDREAASNKIYYIIGLGVFCIFIIAISLRKR